MTLVSSFEHNGGRVTGMVAIGVVCASAAAACGRKVRVVRELPASTRYAWLSSGEKGASEARARARAAAGGAWLGLAPLAACRE